jgi:hypothetical protein
MTSRLLGQEGFRWFIGVVEDREDPKKLGRVKVRAFNTYSDSKASAPTESLPWATVMQPINSAAYNKVGISPTGILVGSTVVGFFMDGNECNYPVIFGTIAGIPGNDINNHDVPYEAREINKIIKTPVGPEPESAYGTKYPFNKVIRTESGHVIEVDDTPNKERIHIYHKSGTYSEVNTEGRKVDKIVGDHIEVILKNNTVLVKGNVNVLVEGTYTVESKGNMKFIAPRIDLNP